MIVASSTHLSREKSRGRGVAEAVSKKVTIYTSPT